MICLQILYSAGLYMSESPRVTRKLHLLQKVNAMMAEEFLRVTQCTELDAAMDAALSSVQPPQR